ncbi:syntaxin-16 isoform X1 [Hydra vulgaris]|nr:syntaxin-16 [Hydra vulgaris]
MATRSLTRIFVNFRSSSSRASTKRTDFRSKKFSDDTVALVAHENVDFSGLHNDEMISPEWSTAVEEAEYGISKIQSRIKDLTSLHNKHLNRPSMDDSINEEHTIDITTQEITQLFHQCQRCIQSIQSQARIASKSEQTVIRNVISRLASQLQDLSQTFKQGQSNYLKRMKNREEREKDFFESDYKPDINFTEANFEERYDKSFTTAQLQLVEENNEFVKQREEEISHIIRSINDLNTIFKDLAVMIIDQGTILDRIDYNIEIASVTVEQGLQQLQKSERHQKSNRKMMCILFLSVLLVIMLIVLVITKKK